MKKRIIIGAIAVLMGIGMVFAFSGCDALLDALVSSASSVSGTVVDARDENAAAISGMELTLTSVSDESYTASTTTDTDGSFSFLDLDPEYSPYEITGTGEKDSLTYTLIPQEVELDGLFKSMGNIPALAISVEDANASAFTFILMWPKTAEENGTSNDYDLDLHLTFDTQAQNNATFWFNGDYGNETNYATQRDSVYWSTPTYGGTDIVLDVDSNLNNTVPGVETISLRSAPIDATAVGTALTDNTNGDNAYIYSIYDSTSIDWCGYARAYALKPKSVVLGGDARLSTGQLKASLAEGLMDAGVDVVDLGMTGTEEIYYAASHMNVDGGIEITASHNPIDYNGMKPVGKGAVPIGRSNGLLDIKALAESGEFDPVPEKGVKVNQNNREDYVRHVLSYIEPQKLKPLKTGREFREWCRRTGHR